MQEREKNRVRQQHAYKTIHFSRYCWSGYLPKGGTKWKKKEKKQVTSKVAAALLKYLHSHIDTGHTLMLMKVASERACV